MKRFYTVAIFPLLIGFAFAGEPSKLRTGLVSYKEYEGLLGEDFSGNVFIFRHEGKLFAAMSRHQFDGGVPSQAEDIDGAPVLLDRTKVFKQEDVQILPLKVQNAAVQFMDFAADYELKAGEKLWIERGSNMGRSQGMLGTLRGQEFSNKKFSSKDKPARLVMDLESRADVRGASGIAVIQVATGKPVGVVLEADSGRSAGYIVFEPICLPLASRKTPESGLDVASNHIIIEIREGTVFLKGKRITRETPLTEYEAILGKADRTEHKKNTIYTYDELGLLLYQRPGENSVLSISIDLVKASYDFSPTKTFHGELKVAGQDINRELPQSALRKFHDVRIDPTFAAQDLPFTELTQGKIIVSLTYLSSREHLDGVGISWQATD